MGTPAEFAVSTEMASPGVLTVGISGELDMSTSSQVEEALASAPAVDRVLLDLTKCTFLDSAGVRLLLAAHRKVTTAGGQVELVASDPSILRVLEITNVDTMMHVHSTLEGAL